MCDLGVEAALFQPVSDNVLKPPRNRGVTAILRHVLSYLCSKSIFLKACSEGPETHSEVAVRLGKDCVAATPGAHPAPLEPSETNHVVTIFE